MLENKRYYRIGLVSASALLLLLGMLFFLGLADDFADRIHFVTTFSESVQGLSKGSAVKFKGVPIGEVERISILPEQKIIRVDMKIDPAVFSGFNSGSDNERSKRILEYCLQERDAGLCCRLDLAGVTGMRYVEMDFIAPGKRRATPLPAVNEPGVIYFPSVPGTFSNIIDSVAVSLDNIAKVDIKKISGELEENLQALNNIISDPAIRQTIDRLERITANIEQFSGNISENMTGENMQNIIKSATASLENIKVLTAQLNEKLEAVNVTRFNEQTASIMDSGNRLLEELNDSSGEVEQALQQLSSVLGNLNELIEDIKRDPGALLRGRKADPVNFKNK